MRFDAVVIGAGPAGVFAAGRAALPAGGSTDSAGLAAGAWVGVSVPVRFHKNTPTATAIRQQSAMIFFGSAPSLISGFSTGRFMAAPHPAG